MRRTTILGIGLGALALLIAACDQKPKPAAPGNPSTTPTSAAKPTPPASPAPASEPPATSEAHTPIMPPTSVPFDEPPVPRPAYDAPPIPVQERIAQAIVKACPIADSSDVAARDAASLNLSKVAELIDAPDDVLLWGEFDAKKGVDPAAYSTMQFEPMAWVRGYLSMFMFTGEHSVRKAGEFTVVDLAAKFRSGLPSGDYLYPIWQSADSWRAHLSCTSILLVFHEEALVMALLKSDPAGNSGATRTWDGKWEWNDARGRAQPRAGTFAYVFSPENPDAAGLNTRYLALRSKLEAYNCIGCHTPANSAAAKRLLVLSGPSQFLAARYSLVPLLRDREMKPDDPHANRPGGIPDKVARDELIKMAEAFSEAADTTLQYEQARRAVD